MIIIGGGAGAVNPSGYSLVAKSVNFNAGATDTVIPVTMPAGFTRFLLSAIRISGASGTLTTSTFGLYTAAAAGGIALITAGTACTVSNGTDGTTANTQTVAAADGTRSHQAINVPNIYFRIATPQGSAATADVTVVLVALP